MLSCTQGLTAATLKSAYRDVIQDRYRKPALFFVGCGSAPRILRPHVLLFFLLTSEVGHWDL